jgi:hypothetical protein
MADCVGPHWQAMSVRAQPAAVMALMMQLVCVARFGRSC